MENERELSGTVKLCDDFDDAGPALNSTILNYYKKFGRKRDLEQYFSLSTAQSEIRDPASSFWRKIKAMSDSSDSGDKRSESPRELCRISITCTNLESPSSQENAERKSDSESPPIIVEDVQDDVPKHSDNESIKSDDNLSQKSMDATMDTSINKLLSPSSSITSQRKLEWDSLADVGYANETDCKNSASSLSTLERLALKQHYSNNDTQNPVVGVPTAHSTPLDENDIKSKCKITKTTKMYRKDTDVVQLNMPHGSNTNKPAINVNLTKHISFNMGRDHKITQDETKDIFIDPETIPDQDKAANSQIRLDKEIQTTLPTRKDKSSSSAEMARPLVPVLINLNTLRRRQRRKKVHSKKSKPRMKRKESNKENTAAQEKSGEQVSEAESFEYMPGHIYNQNQMKKQVENSKVSADNKSSLESSGNFTTDSSKGSKHSFTKDLQKSLTLLNATLNKRYDDSKIKQNLIKEVVQRLIKSSYRDDESTTDFLSGLSFGSGKLGMSEATTTSTSEGNTTEKKPKKSILRRDTFNPSLISSTSQSAPNLPSVTNSENPVSTSLKNPLLSSNTESDMSSREKTSPNIACGKKSSEDLYQKYLDALKREQAYKKHLKDKEMFLKQKLVYSDTAIKMPAQLNPKAQIKLKELMKDLTRNNYDDGSGDASKLEDGRSQHFDPQNHGMRKQRSHSVFTLSSGEFQCSKRKDSAQKTPRESTPGPSNTGHYYCSPSNTDKSKVGVTDSSTQIGVKRQNYESCSQKNKIDCKCNKLTHYVSDSATGDIKYVCLCPDNVEPENGSSRILVYKCSRLTEKSIPTSEHVTNACKAASTDYNDASKPGPSRKDGWERTRNFAKTNIFTDDSTKLSKCSQTNIAKLFNDNSDKKATECISSKDDNKTNDPDTYYVHEATRQLQTEISINPRISDPSLCDIKIIGNIDCAKLINEQYRQVSKSSLGKTDSEFAEQDKKRVGSEISDDTSVSSEIKAKRYRRKRTTYSKTSVEERQSDFGNVDGPLMAEELQDNLTIPIQGTNMTLMVKIGQKPHTPNHDDVKKSVQVRDCSIQTPKNSAEYAIPHNTGIGDNFNTLFSQKKLVCKSLSNDGTQSDTSKNLEKSCGVQNDLLDDFFADSQNNEIDTRTFSQHTNSIQHNDQKSVRNTYPKTQPKLFLRSNTDTNNLRSSEFDQDCELKKQESLYPNTITGTANDGPFFRPIKNFPKNTFRPYPESAAGENDDKAGDCFVNAPKAQLCDSSKKSSNSPAGTTFAPHQTQPKCPCPEMAVCGRTCDKTAECFQKVTRSGAERVSHEENPVVPPHTQHLKKPECPCPEMAVCGRTCDETADCFHNATKTGAESFGREKKPLAPPKTLNTSECPCPDTAVCERTCDKTADCFQNATRSGAESLSRAEKLVAPPRTQCLKKPDCPCPETAICGNTCDEEAECFQNANKFSYRRHSTVQETEVPAQVQHLSKPECPCPETAVCERTCDEKAECYTQKPISHTNTKESVSSSSKSQNSENSGATGQSALHLSDDQTQTSKKSSDYNSSNPEYSKNFIIELISDITKRYTKKDIQKNQRKKCFNEIMKILNYLLDTEEPDQNLLKTIHDATSGATDSELEIQSNILLKCAAGSTKLQDSCAVSNPATASCSKDKSAEAAPDLKKQDIDCQKSEKKYVDKGIQLCPKKSRHGRSCTESSDLPVSSECPCTSSDAPTCKILAKIRKECDKYHQKRCKYSHSSNKCETSSSTSVNCEKCKRTHHCHCRSHKCKSKPKLLVDKVKRKCVAYNLIIQTSESMISEETSFNEGRPLRNIVVKVPPKKRLENMPFKEAEAKIEKHLESPRFSGRFQRSRSCPNESGISSADDTRRAEVYTVREYLERNRPDFLEQASRRQNCLKMISENRNQVPCAPPRLKMVVVHPSSHDSTGCSQPVTMYCEGVPMPTQCTCTDPYNMHMMQAKKQVTRIVIPTANKKADYQKYHVWDITLTLDYTAAHKSSVQRAKHREFQRELLSMHLLLQSDGKPPLSALSETDLRQLARDLGANMRRKQAAPKFISERDMKKHSEKIYKSLPEVVRKKDELKKQSIKKTNLLMASIFNKNLQKKTLRGTVNLSNYSNVVKI